MTDTINVESGSPGVIVRNYGQSPPLIGTAVPNGSTFTVPAAFASPPPGAGGWSDGRVLVTGPGAAGWLLPFVMGPNILGTGPFAPGQTLTLRDANNNPVLVLTSFMPGPQFLALAPGAAYTLQAAGFAASVRFNYQVWFDPLGTGPLFWGSVSLSGVASSPRPQVSGQLPPAQCPDSASA